MSAVSVPSSPRVSVQRYEPVGAARDLIAARDREVLAVGPAGTGKTLAACWKIHLACLRHPGIRVLMTRKTLEALKSGALNTYINGVQPRLYGVQTFGGNKFFPAEFRYPNGSVVLVSGMDKAEKILSSEFDIILVNEVTEPGFSEADWETLLTRLRNGAMPYQQIIADGNPSTPRHWMNVRCNAGVTRRITSTHKDNPLYWDRRAHDWTDVGREYVQGVLANLSGVQRKRLFEGVWAAAEGLVYQSFTPEMIRPMDVTYWRTALCVDVGSRNPTAILRLHQRGDGAWHHVSREVYRRNMTSTDILAAIRDEADAIKPETIYMDPSAKGYIDDLQREGYPVVAAQNDVLEGIQRVQAVLQEGFSIDPSCVSTIEEFGLYAYPSTGRTESDKPIKSDDHCLIAGTMVETETGPRAIETIVAGDRVLTRSGYEPVIAAGMTNPAADVLTVYLSNGETLTGTAGHPVWTDGIGWAVLGALEEGENVMGIERRSRISVARVSAQTERQAVYNLTVANTPEYFANGVLVHNCMDSLRYGIVGMTDPYAPPGVW